MNQVSIDPEGKILFTLSMNPGEGFLEKIFFFFFSSSNFFFFILRFIKKISPNGKSSRKNLGGKRINYSNKKKIQLLKFFFSIDWDSRLLSNPGTRNFR
jgi:hypothetical protein